MFRAKGRRADYDAIRALLHHGLNDLPLLDRIMLGGCDEQAVSSRLGADFDAVEDLAEKGVGNAADNHTQNLGSIGLEAARHSAGSITHFLGNLADPFGSFTGHQVVHPQGTGNRGV